MEHLYLPQGSSPSLVRYSGSSNYLGMSFAEYAERSGHGYFLPPVPHITWTAFRNQHQISQDEIQPFLETWLFCSLIQEVLGVVSRLICNANLYRHEDFVREQAALSPTTAPDAVHTSLQIVDVSEVSLGSSVPSHNIDTEEIDRSTQYLFCTSRLPELLEIWATQLQGRTSHSKVEHNRLVQCLTNVSTTLGWIGSDFDTMSKSVICITAEVLGSAVDRAFAKEAFFNENGKCPMSWALLGWRQPDIDKMILHGWCPSEAANFKKRGLQLQTMHFLANMKRLHPITRHASCNIQECISHQPLQKPCHRKADCPGKPCGDFSIVGDLMTQMMEIIDRCQIPLIDLIFDSSTSELDVRIVPYTPDSEYVAISHVWSHGLGNQTANALPWCQIRHLHEVIRRTRQLNEIIEDKTTLVWIDTLCCPATDESAKVKVLSQMKDIYEFASCVIVLDSELQQINMNHIPRLERAMRLLNSDWMKRLWTLQEAYLAKHLAVEFHDCVAYVDSLQTLQPNAEPINRTWIAFYVKDLYLSIRKKSSTDPLFPLYTMDFLITSTRDRHVTEASDEPICLATVLGLETKIVAETPESQRMQKMWELMLQTSAGIPSSIIFHPAPKLEVLGYRWAPSTLLPQGSYILTEPLNLSTDPSHRGMMQSEARGLLVQFQGLILSKVGPIRTILQQLWNLKPPGYSAEEGTSWVARDQSGRWYLLFTPNSELLGSFRGSSHTASQLNNPSENSQYAIILRGSLGNDGLFVKIKELGPQTIYVTALHRTICVAQPPAKAMVYEAAYQKTLILEQDLYPTGAHSQITCTSEQLWTAIQEAAAEVFLEQPDLEGLMQTFMNLPKSCMLLFIGQLLARCFHFVAEALPDSQVWCVD